MGIKKIEKKDWYSYFGTFTRNFLKDDQPEYIEIQILSESIGVQPETHWMVLRGITYDHRSDLLEISLDGMDHMIMHPVEIFVDQETDGWLTHIQVTDQDGKKEILDIR